MADTTRRKWVGKSIRRLEDPKLLAGEARYIDDVTSQECSTPPSSGARTPTRGSSASTRAGRRRSPASWPWDGQGGAVLAGPVPAFCAEPVVQHAIAIEKVRFAGEAVAAVAAVDRYVARTRSTSSRSSGNRSRW